MRKALLLIYALVLLTIGAFALAPHQSMRPEQQEPFFGGTLSGVETFDTYSNGTDLHNASDGSGWAGAWSASGSGVWSASNSAPGQGANSLYITRTNPGGGEPYISRQLSSAINSETNIKLMLRRGGANSNVNDYYFNIQPNSGTVTADGYYEVGFTSGSNITLRARGGSTITLVSGASQNTWYYVVLQIDPTNYRIRGYASTAPITVEPTWSSYSTGNSGTINTTSMGYIGIAVAANNNGTSDYLVDDIGPWSAAAATTPDVGTIIFFE